MSCSVGTCLYDDALSWFGCCTGTARSDCQLFTSCVGSASLSSCLGNSRCAGDDYALACTAASAGVCMTMWGEVDEGTVSHFVCGASSTRVQVLATPAVAESSGTVRSSATAFSSGGGLPRSSTGGQASSVGVEDDSSSAAPSSRSASASDGPRISPAAPASTVSTRAATSAVSTGGAVRTAQAVVGAVGGFAGLIAWFV